MDPVYFQKPEQLREWLDEHHATDRELVVGIYKKGSGIESIDWVALVDEVLCYGWIDGVARRIDDDRYCIRVTPRKTGSIWSQRNIDRVAALSAESRMRPAGIRAFEARREDRSGIYSFEQKEKPAFTEEFSGQLAQNAAAYEFFVSQAAWYQRAATHWVMSAKRAATRISRMNQLIEDSANGRTIKPLTRNR
jgi:uncharacterized protein YdeI (YjbR/CyaY-like superfamily)